MTEKVSVKLSYLQFLCSLAIIGLHTVFAKHFSASASWALQLNNGFRTLFDAATSTFFFLSAMLFYRKADAKAYVPTLLARMRTLVIPYLFWSAAVLVHQQLRAYLINGFFPQLPLLDILRLWLWEPANGVLWFVQVLLGYVLVFPLIRWGVRRKWPAIVAGLASLLLRYSGWVPVPYASMLFWLPCYLTGAYLGYHACERMFTVPFVRRRWHYGVAALLFAGLFGLARAFDSLYYLYWQFTPLLVWVLADPLAALPRPAWWVNASFYLFCSHLLFEHYAVRLYQAVFGLGNISFAMANVLLPLLCAALALLCAAVVRKVAPSLYQWITGGRDGKHISAPTPAAAHTKP